MFKTIMHMIIKSLSETYLKPYIVKTIAENDQKIMIEQIQKNASSLTNLTSQPIGYVPKLSSNKSDDNGEKNRIGFI